MAIELAKTNLYAADSVGGVIIAKTNLYVSETIEPAFPTPNILATKVAAMTVARFITPGILANKSLALVPINFPTEFINATMARAMVVHRENHELVATKSAALVVCKGRRAHPEITPWTFTIDGHTFLVINLYNETLVYDFHSGQWGTWGGAVLSTWRPQVGQNWIANIGAIMGGGGGVRSTNVVCGDDTSDTLYFLDPELATDDTFEGTPGQKFSRIITGQIAIRGHDYVDVPAVELTGSNGDSPFGEDMDVELKISDDKGHTYWSAGVETVVAGTFDVTLSWRSLGSFTGPGRLFRFIDNGAVYRIDGMDIPDGK